MGALLTLGTPTLGVASQPADGIDAIKASNAVVLDAVGAQEVADLLREVGIDPEVREDPVGDPLLRGVHMGAPFLVLFYDCGGEPKACHAIQFRGYVPRPEGLPDDAMGQWNRTRRLGRAYLDADGDPTLEGYVRLDGGVTPEHLRRERDGFLKAYEIFRDVFMPRR